MTSQSYYVSTPRWTVRMDIAEGRILRSSARYVWRVYGTPWTPWLAEQQRVYGQTLRCVGLDAIRTCTVRTRRGV